MKPNLWIFSIEPISTRYTIEWHKFLPIQLEENLSDTFNVVQIDGIQKNSSTTPGAFLNFSDTNYWKSSQLCNFLDKHNLGNTTPNDQFLFADAWNPTVIQLKYISELMGFKWKFHGLWHAGSWDKNDFLGRIVGNASWIRNTENAMFNCYHNNFFATRFHVNLFAENLLNIRALFEKDAAEELIQTNRTVKIVGWPMEYLKGILAPYATITKKNKIIFPHRIAPEKQVEMFKDLAAAMPEYEWLVAQEHNLTKHEYHTHLAESKIVFSANLQETLGISMYEGALVGTYPLNPNRLSYTEMWTDGNLYPSNWTEDWKSYQKNKNHLIDIIRQTMNNSDEHLAYAAKESASFAEYFFNGEDLYRAINSLK